MNAKRLVLPVLATLMLLVCQSAGAFYNPHTGRWLSRDPIEEGGGLSLYDAMLNSAPGVIDPNGLDTLLVCSDSLAAVPPTVMAPFTPTLPPGVIFVSGGGALPPGTATVGVGSASGIAASGGAATTGGGIAVGGGFSGSVSWSAAGGLAGVAAAGGLLVGYGISAIPIGDGASVSDAVAELLVTQNATPSSLTLPNPYAQGFNSPATSLCRPVKRCKERHPDWPACSGPLDAKTAVLEQVAKLYPGWSPYSLEITDSGPAKPLVCGSAGGEWHSVKTKFFAVAPSGTVYYTMPISVVCCNCCRYYVEGKSCRIIHPGQGSGGVPPPPSEPPFHGQR